MGIGQSDWLQGKIPVKLKSFKTGGIFTPSGWYFAAPGTFQHFHLKTAQMRKLMMEGRAFLVVDEEVVKNQIARFRGEKDRKPQTQQQEASQQQADAAKKKEQAAAQKRAALEERLRQEKLAKERRLFEEQQKRAEAQRKRVEELQRQQEEAAKKKSA